MRVLVLVRALRAGLLLLPTPALPTRVWVRVLVLVRVSTLLLPLLPLPVSGAVLMQVAALAALHTFRTRCATHSAARSQRHCA